MKLRIAIATGLLAATLSVHAQADPDLAQRLAAVESNPEYGTLAAYERLQARQALDVLANARRSDRDSALYVAQRRVQIAEIAARSQAAQREVDRLERERSELLVDASRRDAARARAEAERLRVQAQIQAEEAERLRQQAAADAQAILDVEATLEGVAGAQTAKLSAAREKEAALARQEAELIDGGKLPPSRRDARGEVFSLAGDAFASGQASLTGAAATSVKALATYLLAGPQVSVRVEGHTDNQGAAAANLALSQRRADAVRDALVAAGLPRARAQAVGRGHLQPVTDNASAAGRAKNRRVEIVVSSK
jgi:outer membrane protein OmpA-like peptidoglycan-associated protein